MDARRFKTVALQRPIINLINLIMNLLLTSTSRFWELTHQGLTEEIHTELIAVNSLE